MEKKNRFSRPFWLVLDVKNRYLSDTNKMLKYRKHCRRDYQLVLNFIFDFEETKTNGRRHETPDAHESFFSPVSIHRNDETIEFPHEY